MSRVPGRLHVVEGDPAHVVADAVLVSTSGAMRSVGPPSSLLTPAARDRTADRRRDGWTLVRDPGTNDPPVWFANVTSCAPDVASFVALATRYVRAAARVSAAADHPRIALGVLGAERRGMERHRGALITALVSTLSDLARDLSVDVVLTTHGIPQYSAVQHARRRRAVDDTTRQLLASAPDGERLEAVVTELSQHALAGRLALFVGAGVSRGAGAPGWQELLDLMARDGGAHQDELERLHELELRDQAQVIFRRLGERRYERLLERHLASNRHALAHGLLANLDPHEIVTTNFDTLMEDAMGEARRPAVLPNEAVGPDGRWILKLHGTITDPGSLVMTRSDYLGLPGRSQALLGTVQGMLMTKQMLFVGYSLTDDSFHKVVHEVRQSRADRDKLGTALTLFDDPMLDELWGDVIDIVPVARRPRRITDRDVAIAARRLDHVLDEMALRASDIGAFLLDPSYDDMLDDDERLLRDAVSRSIDAGERAGVIGQRLVDTLRSMFPAH